MKWLALLFWISSVGVAADVTTQPPAQPNFHQAAPSRIRHWNFYPLNLQARFERSESQDWERRVPLNFAAGYSWKSYDISLEYSQFNDESGAGSYGMDRRHMEGLVWGRYVYPFKRIWSLRGGAGLGLIEESIETRFNGQKVSDRGQATTLTAISAGVQLTIQKTLQLALEGRVFSSGSLDPNPQPDAVLRLGFSL